METTQEAAITRCLLLVYKEVFGLEMIIFIGIQAVGKSEFYKHQFCNTHIRINLDMLKTRNREKIFIEACIRANQPFVIDNTNPTVNDRKKYIDIAKTECFRVVGYFFESNVTEALARNANRVGKEKVPAVAIKSTYAKLEIPTLEEGFDKLFNVRINPNRDFMVETYTYNGLNT